MANYSKFYEFTNKEIEWIAETVKAYEYDEYVGEYVLKSYADIVQAGDDSEDEDTEMFMSIWLKVTLEHDLDEYISATRDQRHHLEGLFSEIFLMVEAEEANRIIREKYRRG